MLITNRLNLYVFCFITSVLRIYIRNKSKKDTTNVKTIHQGGNESNVETYTELGNTVPGESENQYDALSRRENYINTNVL